MISSISQVKHELRPWGEKLLIPEDPEKFTVLCTGPSKKEGGGGGTNCKFVLALKLESQLIPGVYFVSTKVYSENGNFF